MHLCVFKMHILAVNPSIWGGGRGKGEGQCNSRFGPPADLVPLNYILADLIPPPKC